MSNNFLFDETELLEQTPTSLLTDLTSQPDPGEITAHTKTSVPQQPVNPGGQPLPGNNTTGPQMPPPPTAGPQSMNAGQLFGAEMAVTMLNVALPAIIVIILKKTTGRVIAREQFEATEGEQEMIKPALQNYLNSVNFTVESPLHALVLVCAVVYGTKVVEVINEMPPGRLSKEGAKNAFTSGKKETRGRHKKDCQCIICKQRREREAQ